MAKGTITITSQFKNNSKTASVISKVVDLVVVDNRLVADFREANPGVKQ